MEWLIFLTLIFTNSASAYSWNKCYNKVWKEYGGFAGSIFSTSSYVSSTGNCAMTGQVEHDQKVFLALNLDKIKLDSARGGGEYLEAYAHIANIRQEDLAIYFAKIQKDYSSIFRDEDIENIYNRIQNASI